MKQLKLEARGDATLPEDKRVYITVRTDSLGQKYVPPTGKFFFNADSKVGKALDIVCSELGVRNNNISCTEVEQLRFFHIETGRFLEFRDQLKSVCKSGDSLALYKGPVPA